MIIKCEFNYKEPDQDIRKRVSTKIVEYLDSMRGQIGGCLLDLEVTDYSISNEMLDDESVLTTIDLLGVDLLDDEIDGVDCAVRESYAPLLDSGVYVDDYLYELKDYGMKTTHQSLD